MRDVRESRDVPPLISPENTKKVIFRTVMGRNGDPNNQKSAQDLK